MIQSAMRTAVAVLLIASLATMAAAEKSGCPKRIEYGKPRQTGLLADEEINESSGLARSFLNPDAFWTHNDSGDTPRLFLINRGGQTLATLTVEGVRAIDWEDMASFKHEGKSYLLIGDVGDNRAKRAVCTLYVVKEPRIDSESQSPTLTLRPSLAIPFTYEDGPRDCESVAADPANAMIYLVSKRGGNTRRLYELPLPTEAVSSPLTARAIATPRIPTTTAMDISPDGLRAVVLTYGHAREYVRKQDESWAKSFSRKPRVLTMPRRKQGEAICYGADGKSLYLTSEGMSQPIWEVPAVTGNN